MDKWEAILVLAQRWAFKEVEKLCVRELEKLSIPPVDKIHLYQYFKLDKSLLIASYIELTARSEPLDLEEGRKLGIDTSVQVARARELFRGSNLGKRPSVNLQDPELHELIQTVFGLGEMRPNGSTQSQVIDNESLAAY